MKFRLPPAWGVAAVAAMFGMTTQAPNMSPVTVTGFNVDVVIENTASGPPYSSFATELNPGEGLAFYQGGLPGKTYGMPTSGGFTSALDGATVFQLQTYTSPNALVLSSGTGLTAGTLTLSSPAMYSRIAVVANSASANSSSAGTLTFNFTDGSTYVTTYNAPDWFGNSGAALGGTERISLSNGSTSGAATNPRFYQTTIDLTGALGPN